MSFTLQELIDLKDLSLRGFQEMPGRCRLPGMARDMTVEEKVAVAYYQASFTLLNRQGAVKDGWLNQNGLTVIEQVSNADPLDAFESSGSDPRKRRR